MSLFLAFIICFMLGWLLFQYLKRFFGWFQQRFIYGFNQTYLVGTSHWNCSGQWSKQFLGKDDSQRNNEIGERT